MADRLAVALIGCVTTIAVTAAGFLLVSAVSLWRCGGLFGESSAVAGTLSQSLCRDNVGRIVFAVVVLGPMVTGLAGTARATAFRDMRPLTLPLAVAAAVPGATTLLYLVSGLL